MGVESATQPSKLRWGELEEDDGEDLGFLLPPKQVIGPDENGIKKVVEYKFNDEGNKVKTTTTPRIRKLANARFGKRAVERSLWPKFGDAVHEDVGSRLTVVSTEEILPERPIAPGTKQESRNMGTRSVVGDVIEEILVKLPVKTLIRFRCVCKSWYNLITSPYFTEKHLKYQNQYSTISKENECILILRRSDAADVRGCFISFHSYELLSVIAPPLQITTEHGSCKITTPCNGLFCFNYCEDIILCNPAIREFKVLPLSPFPRLEGWEYYIHAIGFGFDSKANDYKALAVFQCLSPERNGNDKLNLKAEMYSLNTNSWREIYQDVPCIMDLDTSGIIVNGSCHWLTEIELVDGYGSLHWLTLYERVAAFDMCNEVFWEMELPEEIRHSPIPEKEYVLLLTVHDESLALFAETINYGTTKCFDIWIMQEYGVEKSWTKLLTIQCPERTVCPHLLWKSEALVEYLAEPFGTSYSLISSDGNNDFKINSRMGLFTVMIYRESLISIK